MANPSRYRFIKFYGGRILQSREVSEVQRIQEGLDSGGVNRVAFDLDAIYREGATLNILPTITSNSVTFAAINSSLPMLVFVRGRWEILQPSEVGSLSIPSNGGNIYLNWVLRQVTSAEDVSLVDTNTGEPTADMGELDLSVSTVNNSGVALGSTQFEKNTSPIILFTYNSNQTLVSIDNVNAATWANSRTSGLVSLTTDDSSGKAASANDLRLSDGRTPLPGSVEDVSVRTPIAVNPASNNPDGTPVYNLNLDPGGIDSKKIIHSPGSQLLSDAIEWIKAKIANFNSILTSHIGVRLGLSTTHPMPSATDVGATPLSHVGMPLGLPGSHPASVTTNSGGFSLNRDASVLAQLNDPAYAVFNSGNVIAALLHSGDVYSKVADAFSVNPIPNSQVPNPIIGSLGLLSVVAQVVSQHINQTTDGNPHGLKLGDLVSPLVQNDVTSQRSFNTQYNNPDILKPMFVAINLLTGATGCTVSWTINGLNFAQTINTVNNLPANQTLNLVIPAQGTFELTYDFQPSIVRWVESV